MSVEKGTLFYAGFWIRFFASIIDIWVAFDRRKQGWHDKLARHRRGGRGAQRRPGDLRRRTGS